MKQSLRPTLPVLCAALLVSAGNAQADPARFAGRESSSDRDARHWSHRDSRPEACRPPPCREQRVTDLRLGHIEYRTVPVWHGGYWQSQIDPCGRRQNYWIPGYYEYTTVSFWVPDAPRGAMVGRGWRR